MKLSIIICVYNTPRELFEGCLRSLQKSTLFADGRRYEAEIITVDDGSSTDYSDLIEKYGIRYTKTENRGIFSARALGISLATGEYVAFVDSDDTVSFDYHAPMVEKADVSGADIIINDWAYHTDSSRYFTDADSTIMTEDMRLIGGEGIRVFLSQEGREHSYYVLWNKVYRRELLQNAFKKAEAAAYGIEGYNYSEDVLINFFAFLDSRLVENVHTGYYFYRIHSSQSVSASSREKLKKQIFLMGFTLCEMEKALKGNADFEKLSKHITAWREFISRSHFTHAKSGGFKELYPYIKETYGVKDLKRSTYRDEICGMRCVPLPDNFIEIDGTFLDAWTKKTLPSLPNKANRYMLRVADRFISLGFTESNELQVPKPVIPFKKRLRFDPLLMRIARILFPKGSKARSFLKKHM